MLHDVDLQVEIAHFELVDIEDSTLITPEDFHNMSLWLRFKQAFSRLLSPIL